MNTIDYPHPGYDLKSVLEEIGLSQSDLSKYSGIPSSRISEVVNGRRSITAEYLIRLGMFFGQDESFWLTMQKEYDLRKIKAARIRKEVKPLESLR